MISFSISKIWNESALPAGTWIFLASYEIPLVLRNLKIHYYIHKVLQFFLIPS